MSLSILAFTNLLCIADVKTKLQNMESSFLEYTQRITKTLRYVKMPERDRPSLPLTELMIANLNENREKTLEWVQLQEAATISLGASVTPCSAIIAIIYIERLKILKPEYFYNTSPSDLFVISLLIAGKYLFDVGEQHESFNELWAAHSCKPIDLINKEEMLFLEALDWNLFVNDTTFFEALKNVEAVISLREGSKRGYFTYAELTYLGVPILSVFRLICSTLSLCMASYTLSLLVATYIIRITSLHTVSQRQNVTLPVSNQTVTHVYDTNLNMAETAVKDAIVMFGSSCAAPSVKKSRFSTRTLFANILYCMSSAATCAKQSPQCPLLHTLGENDTVRYQLSPYENQRSKKYGRMPPEVAKIQKINKSDSHMSQLFSDYYFGQNHFSINVDPIVA